MPIWLYLFVTLSAIALVLWWPRYRMRKALAKLFPDAWETVLRRNVPVYEKLHSDQQREMKQLVKHFLHTKEFTGCGGLQITDEICLTIACQACLLLLNRPHSMYGKLRYIYVYPSAYIAPHTELDESGVVTVHAQGRSGESWGNGKVILSWDDVLHGVRNFKDGRNVALHEFAHQLDQENGKANGAPLLDREQNYQCWSDVFSAQFELLQRQAKTGSPSIFDYYGATNPAEFFAVASEVFFEKAHQFSQQHPKLYRQLKKYYQVDPIHWH